MPFRPGREELAVRGQAAHDVLGQLGPVHPDDQLPPAGHLVDRGDVRLYVVGRCAGAQRGGVHPERVHAHLGDVPPVDDSPDRVRRAGPAHVGAQDRLAAIEERGGPALGVKAQVIRAEHAIKQGPAHLAGQQPVVAGRRPGGVREVRHANVAGGVTQPFPQQSRDQAEVVVLDQGASARRRRLLAPRALRQGLVRQRIGERLVIGQVGLPVAPELTAEQGLVRDVEQHVVNKPQGRVGHVVVRPVEGVPRDVEHPHGNIGGDPGALGGQAGRRGPRSRRPTGVRPRGPRR